MRSHKCALSTFTEGYSETLSTESNLPRDFLADLINDPSSDAERQIGSLELLCEDFAQGVALPLYGHVCIG